jgi:hypothetical protein
VEGCGAEAKDRRGLVGHMRTHTPATCPEPGCGWTGTELALGPHRTKHRKPDAAVAMTVGDRLAGAAAERRRRGRATTSRKAVRASLQAVLPGIELAMVSRVAAFVDQYRPDEHDRWLVATATAGPWLCRSATVGPVIHQHARDSVVVVVAVAAVYRHLSDRLAG